MDSVGRGSLMMDKGQDMTVCIGVVTKGRPKVKDRMHWDRVLFAHEPSQPSCAVFYLDFAEKASEGLGRPILVIFQMSDHRAVLLLLQSKGLRFVPLFLFLSKVDSFLILFFHLLKAVLYSPTSASTKTLSQR